MALSCLNLPSALKAAIGIGKRTLGHPASLPRHKGRSKAYCVSWSRSPNTRAMMPGVALPATISYAAAEGGGVHAEVPAK